MRHSPSVSGCAAATSPFLRHREGRRPQLPRGPNRMIAAPITNGFRRPTLSDRGPAANPTTRGRVTHSASAAAVNSDGRASLRRRRGSDAADASRPEVAEGEFGDMAHHKLTDWSVNI